MTMAVEKEHLATGNTASQRSHIEVVTENGFCIARACDLEISGSDSASKCHFIVGLSFGGVRSVRLKFSDAAIAMAQGQRQTLLSLTSSFWLYCAERHLATYIWENNGCPSAGHLTIDSLSTEDLLMASRWE
jgi:hypothetical protein